MICLIFAELILPFGSSRVMINVPVDPPPASCGKNSVFPIPGEFFLPSEPVAGNVEHTAVLPIIRFA